MGKRETRPRAKCCRAPPAAGGVSKQQLGDDMIRQYEITAAASAQAQAANPQVAALPAQMAQLQTQMGELQTQQGQLQTQLAALAGLPAQMTHLVAMVANKRRRSRNTQAAAAYPQESPALAPLAKEQTPAANAPNAAPVGAMPPPGLFLPTWEALLELSNAQLDALADFYGEDFGQPGRLGPRRKAFMSFIKN
ncbi:hypothetical protein ABPG77_001386 [Micractinium sp. CCAP 211/92]